MLLGVSIFSVILLSLYSTFSIAVKIQSRSKDLHAISRNTRNAFHALARDLENSVLFDFSGSWPELASMRGTAERIIFLVSRGQGLFFVEYYLGQPELVHITKTVIGQHVQRLDKLTTFSRQEDNRIYFMRRETPWLSYVNHSSRGVVEDMVGYSVKKDSLKFSYGFFAQTAGTKVLSFQDSWDNKNFLPAMVRTTMTFVDENGLQQNQQPLGEDIVLPMGQNE